MLLLPGWDHSGGARLERDWAIHLGLEVIGPVDSPAHIPVPRSQEPKGAMSMTFIRAGRARLDLFTDSLLLDIGTDTFVVPLDRLADLTSHRAAYVAVSRRYWGDVPGKFEDVTQGLQLRRSWTGLALMLSMAEGVFSAPICAVLEVTNGIRDTCAISQLVTDARQLDDATSQQATLPGVRA